MTEPKTMTVVQKHDHPDYIGGMVWSECELRWINERLAAQAAQIERLREALKRYADHDVTCLKGAGYICTCGFDLALKETT